MKLKFYAILLTVFGFISGNAQDLHFTQYEFVPIHMNPANTADHTGLGHCSEISLLSDWSAHRLTERQWLMQMLPFHGLCARKIGLP